MRRPAARAAPSSVDLSNTYLDWAHENLLLNGFRRRRARAVPRRLPAMARGAGAAGSALRFDLRGSADLLQFQAHGGCARRAARSCRDDSPLVEAAAPVRAAWCSRPTTRASSSTRRRSRICASRTSAPHHPEGLRTPRTDSSLLLDSLQVRSRRSNHWQLASSLRYSFPTMSTRTTLTTRTALIAAMAIVGSLAAAASAADQKDPINPTPTAQDWQALAKLPDWSGVWTPVISDQVAQEKTNAPPWNPRTARQIAHMYAEEDAGRPFPIIDHCFPTGMPSWMLITHNAFEILFTPGRVTILGEGDGNRLRRIYTDGRPHPPIRTRAFTVIPSATGTRTRWWWIPWRCCRKSISRSMKPWACRTTATCTSSSACTC